MLGRTYEAQVCSVARALEVLGERWTLLIVRDALFGLRRFEEFQRSLGVARNVLTDRLNPGWSTRASCTGCRTSSGRRATSTT
jgi:DNA-binding HxlR family transcriptional regulator